ncbi:MAG: hypothetical protein QF684_07665 [Candidatus Thalassarchaeaceae archaeon]|nr:hypothetical protein [Candidatus Thalassarchaeaceae archaeon]
MSNLRKRTMSAVMALLFVSLAMPGCLSLVVGREMMESTRGFPEVREEPTLYDLSHTFVIDGTEILPTQGQKTLFEPIPVDDTVREVIIYFETTVNYFLGDADIRYVHVELLWCEDDGSGNPVNCDDSNPIYEVMADNGSHEPERTELDRNVNPFESGIWSLTVDGRGTGWNTGLTIVDEQDSWILRVTVVRPCLSFPESPEECTPTIEFE